MLFTNYMNIWGMGRFPWQRSRTLVPLLKPEPPMIKVSRGAVNLPVGVQLVAPSWRDEVCMRLMRELEARADFHLGSSKL